MDIYITDIQNNGELIILSDSTKWKISSFDAFYTRMWARYDRIIVSGSTLTNTSRFNKTVGAIRAY